MQSMHCFHTDSVSPGISTVRMSASPDTATGASAQRIVAVFNCFLLPQDSKIL